MEECESLKMGVLTIRCYGAPTLSMLVVVSGFRGPYSMVAAPSCTHQFMVRTNVR